MDISAVTVEVQKLTLKPGDILALRVDRILSNEQIDSMRERLEQIRPDGVKIAILDATCQLQIFEPPNDHNKRHADTLNEGDETK